MALTIKVANARLRKLAAFLYKLPPEKFYFGNYVLKAENGCGTVCCAIGWLPRVFPEDWHWVRSVYGDPIAAVLKNSNLCNYIAGYQPLVHAEKYFKLNSADTHYLFHPCRYNTLDQTTAEQVADRILEFVEQRSA